ncbi:cytochrome c biogenesis protein [Chitinimonas prasina]|uniref:Cytochrome c biogenesis protein n=1 Tax=Chitinimonas prasina TaxID=1434937 RepID=A0ABQ5YDK5_9NEIS|nr:cytochrome c biogenesis protein ResB [Chitinimonas prasina]GLR12641.1 cytochrome c biogenesis protein [Chitinimonas prasina]
MRRLSFGRALYELLSSMRFAISLLTLLAIASIIGTVLQQNQPYTSYAVEFGDFWFRPFEWLGLYDVYHAGWFIIMLGFLVGSTSLCIYRHLPGILRDIRSYREQAALKSLRAMAHQQEIALQQPLEGALTQAEQWLTAQGYRHKRVVRDEGVMLAAKKGSLQRLGYLFAHAAIVVICIGGLLDGNLPLKLQSLLGIKEVETRNTVPVSEIGEKSKLTPSNLSFRGVIDMPEGETRDVAWLNAGPGYYVQELPFAIKLNKFHVEHYSTGQPKLFASDIEVTSKASGKVTKGTVKVNHPLIVDGVAIYQSSFGDGGSPLKLAVWDWLGAAPRPQELAAVSLASQAFRWGGQPLTLEFGELRPFNIENLEAEPEISDFGRRMQDARQVKADKKVKNVGPSIQFKVRDAQGQAVEYLNYLSPFEDGGRFYLMSGMRRTVAAPFAFVRIPLDAEFSPQGFMQISAVLHDPAAWPEIARRTAAKAERDGAISPAYRKEFEQSLVWVLQRFADGGFTALQSFLDERVPKDKQEAVGQTYIKLLQGAVLDAADLSRQRANLAPVEFNDSYYRFLMDSLVAVSASFDYGHGFYLQPVGFEERKSSGFQVTRSPGQPLVYLGSLLLVLGIFCMFYIRENRIWVWAQEGRLLLAFSSNRRDAQTEQEFAAHSAALSSLASTHKEEHHD